MSTMEILSQLVAADITNPFEGVTIDFSWLTGKFKTGFGVALGTLWAVLLIVAGIKLMPAVFHIRDAMKKNMSHEVEHARKELMGSALVFIVMGCIMVVISAFFVIINLIAG